MPQLRCNREAKKGLEPAQCLFIVRPGKPGAAQRIGVADARRSRAGTGLQCRSSAVLVSIGLNDFASLFAVVQCTGELTTAVDQDGFYTIVIVDDPFRLDWLPLGDTWLPWRDADPTKTVFLRNLLPSDAVFPYSIQGALAARCTVALDCPNFPKKADVIASGLCAERQMGAYYPVAAWCDRSMFIQGGGRRV